MYCMTVTHEETDRLIQFERFKSQADCVDKAFMAYRYSQHRVELSREGSPWPLYVAFAGYMGESKFDTISRVIGELMAKGDRALVDSIAIVTADDLLSEFDNVGAGKIKNLVEDIATNAVDKLPSDVEPGEIAEAFASGFPVKFSEIFGNVGHHESTNLAVAIGGIDDQGGLDKDDIKLIGQIGIMRIG